MKVALQLHHGTILGVTNRTPEAVAKLPELLAVAGLCGHSEEASEQLLLGLMALLPQNLVACPWGRATTNHSGNAGGRDDVVLRASLAGAMLHVASQTSRQDPSNAFLAAKAVGLCRAEEVFEVLTKMHYALHTLDPHSMVPIYEPLEAFLGRSGIRAFQGEDQSPYARKAIATLHDLDPWRDPEPRAAASMLAEVSPHLRDITTLALPALLRRNLTKRGNYDLATLCACTRDLWEREAGRPITDKELVLAILHACSVRLANSHPAFLALDRLLPELPGHLQDGHQALALVQQEYAQVLPPTLRGNYSH